MSITIENSSFFNAQERFIEFNGRRYTWHEGGFRLEAGFSGWRCVAIHVAQVALFPATIAACLFKVIHRAKSLPEKLDSSLSKDTPEVQLSKKQASSLEETISELATCMDEATSKLAGLDESISKHAICMDETIRDFQQVGNPAKQTSLISNPSKEKLLTKKIESKSVDPFNRPTTNEPKAVKAVGGRKVYEELPILDLSEVGYLGSTGYPDSIPFAAVTSSLMRGINGYSNLEYLIVKYDSLSGRKIHVFWWSRECESIWQRNRRDEGSCPVHGSSTSGLYLSIDQLPALIKDKKVSYKDWNDKVYEFTLSRSD